VTNGELKQDNRIGRFISKALRNLPKFDAATLETIFSNNLQDLLMVVYLSNLTRTQLILAEKLQKNF
jgi:translation initiation factor 3 subunit F